MKKNQLLISAALIAILFAFVFTACDNGSGPGTGPVTVNALNLTGMVTAPVKDTAPATVPIDHAQYTGTIAWQGGSGGAVTLAATEAENWWKSIAGWSSKFGTSDAAPWKWDSASNRPVLWFE